MARGYLSGVIVPAERVRELICPIHARLPVKDIRNMIDIQGIPVVAARLAAARKLSSTQPAAKKASKKAVGKGSRGALRPKEKAA
jgi:hypothetical protein